MRLIDRDSLAAYLTEWQRRLAEHNECGGCAAELIGRVAQVLDGWPTADGGTDNPSDSPTASTSPCTGEPWGYERMRVDAQPPRQEDADAQGCVLAWDEHGSGWVVRHWCNLQGAQWWARLPGRVDG